MVDVMKLREKLLDIRREGTENAFHPDARMAARCFFEAAEKTFNLTPQLLDALDEAAEAWEIADGRKAALVTVASQRDRLMIAVESVLRGVELGEPEEAAAEALELWRELRGEAGKDGWRWWWKAADDESYQSDCATREAALMEAEHDGVCEVEIIEARSWSDDFDVENARFAETRNHEAGTLADLARASLSTEMNSEGKGG